MGRRPSAWTPAALLRVRLSPRPILLQIVLVSLITALTPGQAWAVPPANDDFDNATVISTSPFTDSLDTREATTAVDDPNCWGNGHSVWYAFTPDQNMWISANTFGSNYNTTLSVWTGTRGNLSPVLFMCNDDAEGLQSEVEFDATSGTTYFFMVASYAGEDGGDLTFSVEVFPPPANDDFDSATVISGLPFADSLNTSGASRGEGDPFCHGWDRTVWYAFTPGENMRVSAQALSSDYGPAVGVYTGSPLTEVACSYAGPVEFDATSGTTYFMMITTTSLVGGELTFSVERVRLPTTLGLTVSRRRVDYNKSVTVTAHLDAFADATNKTVDIYKTPYGGEKTPVMSGELDESGNFSVPVTMKKKTTFVAEWDGDDGYLPAVSDTKVVEVRVITKTKLAGAYATSGRYKLYHVGDDPKQIGTVIPNHSGKYLTFIFQVYLQGAWRTVDTARFRIRANGSASAFIPNPPAGYNFRVRNRFDGDRDHLGDSSSWRYFRVTS